MPSRPLHALVLLAALATSATSCGGSEATALGDRRERLERLEEQVEEARTLERRLPELERDVAGLELELERLERTLVSNEAEALFRLRGALEESGFGTVELEPLGPAQVDGVELLRFAVSARAPRASLTEQLARLAAQPLTVSVDELSVRVEPESPMVRLGFVAALGLATERR